MEMTLLAIDLGSTHLKAGIFSKNGQLIGAASCDHQLYPDEWGGQVYQPLELVHSTLTIIEKALAMAEAGQQTPITLAGIGIASMAESGLLVDASIGDPRTPIVPWFDQRSQPQAQRLRQEDGALAAAVQLDGVSPNLVFDSIGTAESLIGVFPERSLTLDDYQAGFSYGIFPETGYLYWMGGLSTSGGSLE